jgi:DNA-binding MarR family transcriptional regulator
MDFSPPDNLLQQPLRFAIMAYLTRASSGVIFTEVYRALAANPGSVSIQARELEDAGLVRIDKGFERRKSRTVLIPTPKGRRAFAAHCARLNEMSAPAAVA